MDYGSYDTLPLGLRFTAVIRRGPDVQRTASHWPLTATSGSFFGAESAPKTKIGAD